jgi:hypothetical protein
LTADLVIKHQKIAASSYVTQNCIKVGHWHLGFRFRGSGVSSKKAGVGLKHRMKLHQNGTVSFPIRLAVFLASGGARMNILLPGFA